MPDMNLSEWTPSCRREPMLRVGVILPIDGMNTVRMNVPSPGCRILLDGRAAGEVAAGTAEIVAHGANVVLGTSTGRVGPGSVLALVPIGPEPRRRGAGIELRNMVAGRGFHWQKRVTLTFPGRLEFRAAEGGLLAVNELPLEDYLAGVITAEMSGACPLEFLKSQVLVARSWVLVHTEDKHPAWPIDRCNDDCCQRYQGTSFLSETALRAVQETRGQALFGADGTIIDANYSKSCGGVIEAPEYLWGSRKAGQRAAVDAPAGTPEQRFLPVTERNLGEYLRGDWLQHSKIWCSPSVVPEDQLPRYLGGVDDGGQYFRWTRRYERDTLEQLLREKVFDRLAAAGAPTLAGLTDLKATQRGQSGRAIALEVHYLDSSGSPAVHTIEDQYNIRDALHEKFLYSSAFDVAVERGEDGRPTAFTLSGAGWGHGAGLCQIGALGMAMRGHNAEDIVRHYFDRIEVRSCYA